MSQCSQPVEHVRYHSLGWGRTLLYRVGSDGSSWSSRDGVNWRELNTNPSPNRYVEVCMDRKAGAFVRIHVAVLSAFGGPAPTPEHCCCHKDGNILNNRISNLYWGTPQDNADDTVRHDRSTRGERHPLAKLGDAQVREVLASLGTESNASIARRLGVCRATVRRIASGEGWGHITGRKPRAASTPTP